MSDASDVVLPPGWAQASIEDLFWPLEDGRTLHQGWSPQCEKFPAPTDKEWGVLKTTSIQAGAFHAEHNKHLPGHLEPRPQIEVKAGDILITCAGPRVRCGVACLVRATRPRLMMSGKMYRFRVPPQYIDARFLEAYLLTQEATLAIDKMKTGGSDSGLNLTHDRFRPLPVPVAPLREQERIMDVLEELLSDLDAGEAALERVLAKLKHYRAAVLKAAVEGALTAEWRRQHPATETADALLTRIFAERRRRWEEAQLAKFEAAGKAPPRDWKLKYEEPLVPDTSTLPMLPDGWQWVSMDQLSKEIRNGYSAKPDASAGVPILRISAVRSFSIDLNDRRYLRGSAADYEADQIAPGDLLFTRYNGSRNLVGVCAVVPEIDEPIVHPDKIIRARPIGVLQSSAFAGLSANVGASRRYIEKRIRTTAGQAGISGSDVKTLPVPLPPPSEQVAIMEHVEDQLSVIDHLERDLETKLKSSHALRQSILRHAFTGQLVPQNPDDEPAIELLKRMAIEREERARLTRAAKQSKHKTRTPRRPAKQD